MLRDLIQASGFVSIYSSNYHLHLRDLNVDRGVYMQSRSYGQCDCATSSTCTHNSMPEIDGYLSGCSPLEATLRSTIQCLYEPACIDRLVGIVHSSFVPQPLINQSRFSKDSAMEELVAAMLIESWAQNISYAGFFAQCQPQSCSYVEVQQYDRVYVLTTLLGLYGGMTILLKLLVPFTIQQIDALRRLFSRAME